MIEDNAFGKLVRVYREERQWKQEELAERWGFTREYVSQIECGKRKLDNPEQVTRLADILGIPEEQLVHAGKKGFPKRSPSAHQSSESNALLLQALLQPAESIVKLSWSIWQESAMLTDLTRDLYNLEQRLNEALGRYHGQFRQPALRLLSSVHECLGKQAIERTATQDAVAHFQEMYDIAEELGDINLLTLAMIHQAGMFRRKGRFEASFRRLEVAERRANSVPCWLQGLLWTNYARNFSVYGDEQGFLRSIDRAESIAENMTAPANTITNPFDKIGVLHEKAQGYILLWHPEKALAICHEIDKIRPFCPLREQSSSHIVKAQAYCHIGDLQTGIEHALTGLRMAEMLQSKRYIRRLQQMCDRLSDKPISKERAMQDLRSEILVTWNKLSQPDN